MNLSKYIQLGNAPVGKITKVGNIWAGAYAVDGSRLVALVASGAKTSLDALRAELSVKNGNVKIVPLAERYTYNDEATLYADEDNPPAVFRSRDEILSLDTAVFLHRSFINKKTPGHRYVFAPLDAETPWNDEIFIQQVGHAIRSFVDVPCFPEWYKPLIKAAQDTDNIKKLPSKGCTVYRVTNNPKFWTEQIVKGLQSKRLAAIEL